MTKDLASVADKSTVMPEKMTRKQLLESVARMFASRQDTLFKRVPNLRIETASNNVLRVTSTNGTVLEPVVTLLNAVGVPTEPNLADVKAKLDLSIDDMHEFACHCIGANIAGEYAAKHFEKIAATA